jgi:predicted exporter
MKMPFFDLFFKWWRNKRKLHILIWIVFHASIFLCLLTRGNYSVNSDLTSILPHTSQVKAVSGVEKIINQKLNRGIYILIGHEDFSTARSCAVTIASRMKTHGGFQNIQLDIDSSSLRQLTNFLFIYRYQLLTPEIQEMLTHGRILELSERAFLVLSSPLSLGSLDHLDLDPFLLVNSSLQYYLNSSFLSNMSIGLRDGVLSTDYNGKSWVLISARTAESGFSVQVEDNPIAMIYETAEQISSAESGPEIVFSGAPFHSFESSRQSKTEISMLSTVSMIFIVLMILLVFRSVKPLLATVGAIIVGIVTGLAATLFIFRDVHIFTIVFGTSLIGISLDYALHFFSHWATMSIKKTSAHVIRFILPGISLGLLTTLASYFAFVFTSFPLLQQMALFSIAGLLSSYLSVIFIFPRFKKASEKTTLISNKAKYFVSRTFKKLQELPFLLKIFLGLILLGLSAIGFSQLRLNSDVRTLYSMSPALKKSEYLTSAILKHGSTGVYVLVEGDNPEDLRINEEQLVSDLSQARDEGYLASYLGSTFFIPSRRRQAENYQSIGKYLRHEIPSQMELLGFGEAEIRNWEADYLSKKDQWIDLKNLGDFPLRDLLDMLWLGQINKKYYSMVMLFKITDMQSLQSIVEKSSSRYFINRIREINSTLENLSFLALIILCISYIIIFCGLVFRYKWLRSFKIIIIPCLASCVVISFLHLAGLPFNIFSVMGLILVPGMGTDYVIFFSEGKTRPGSTILAITLSMLTTMLSFGMLGFTSLAGVFGLTVALGVFLSFLLTPLLIGKKDHS